MRAWGFIPRRSGKKLGYKMIPRIGHCQWFRFMILWVALLTATLLSQAATTPQEIRKYFPSIDHQILKELIRKKIRDSNTLWLINRIIDGSNLQEALLDYFPGDGFLTPLERRKGLPIGNLTSQFFTNFYLNPFDHLVKHTLRCPAFLRYVDDLVLCSDSKWQLQAWKEQIDCFFENIPFAITSPPMTYSPFPGRRQLPGTGDLPIPPPLDGRELSPLQKTAGEMAEASTGKSRAAHQQLGWPCKTGRY